MSYLVLSDPDPSGWKVKEEPTMNKCVFPEFPVTNAAYQDQYKQHLASLREIIGYGPKPPVEFGEKIPERDIMFQYQARSKRIVAIYTGEAKGGEERCEHCSMVHPLDEDCVFGMKIEPPSGKVVEDTQEELWHKVYRVLRAHFRDCDGKDREQVMSFLTSRYSIQRK